MGSSLVPAPIGAGTSDEPVETSAWQVGHAQTDGQSTFLWFNVHRL